MSQVAHHTGADPSFPCTRRLGVFLLPPGLDAGALQGYPQHLICQHPFIHLPWVKRGTVRVQCLAQEHNTVHIPGQSSNPDHSVWRQAH